MEETNHPAGRSSLATAFKVGASFGMSIRAMLQNDALEDAAPHREEALRVAGEIDADDACAAIG